MIVFSQALPKLKVYCTPIGFHDAYLAPTSQKTALEAWGSDANLLARRVAAQVDDPALTAEPLAKPGVVIKKVRGTFDEQIAALPEEPSPQKKTKFRQPPAKKLEPRPSRAKLDQAEAELSALQQCQTEE